MLTIEIKNKAQWNQFVTENGSQFLQSWEWGEFQQSLGRKTWRLGVEENGEIIIGAFMVKHSLLFDKSYLYLPRGPVMNYELGSTNYEIVKDLFDKIIEIAKQEKSIFVRLEPIKNICSMFDIQCSIFKPVQPKDEWKLDLLPSEEKLLQSMHPKTRYNIGLAKRYGVKIKEGGKKDFEVFWQLILRTYKKRGLRTHPKNYYYQMLKLEPVKLYLAEYQGRILVANIMVFWGNEVIYLHGGSTNEHKNVMAPYLLFWETIREAKRSGFKYYNFGAVAPEGSDEKHPWYGITRFKRGFGGFEVNYSGTWDLPVSKFWYRLYKSTKRIIS